MANKGTTFKYRNDLESPWSLLFESVLLLYFRVIFVTL